MGGKDTWNPLMTLVLVGVSALFWGGLTCKHRGHWGSRYMLDWCILADISHRFQLKHFFCWGWFCQGVSFNELQGGLLGLGFQGASFSVASC